MSVSRLLRLIVAVGLTALVLYNANPSEVLAAAARADLGWIGVAIALVLIDRTLMALRWIDLLSALTPGSRPAFPIVLRIFFVSSFVSNFVPSVAADMYRAYALARHDVRLAESTASVLMDRVLGVLSMALVGAVALPFAAATADARGLAIALALVFAACGAAAAVVFSERAAILAQRAASIVPWRRLHAITIALTDAVRRYSRHHGELLRVLLMSVLVQAARILQAWCLGRSLGIELPLATYFALLPIILLVMQVPITVNGFGTTQVAFDRLFVPAGAGEAPTFALSVLFLALGIIGSLPGGVLYAMTRPPVGTRIQRMTTQALAIAVATAALAAAWIVGHGAGGALYAMFYVLAATPGLPLGIRLFGRQPAGFVAGALIGYVLTAFGIWTVIAAGVPSGLTFSIAWLVIGLSLAWALPPRPAAPMVTLPAWSGRASAALAFVLLVTLAVSVPPFARVGERDADGSRQYRAYFTADFVWHMALTSELAKFSSPPRNPYLATEPIHYYWTYLLVPAAVSQTGPAPVRDVQTCLKVNAVLTGLLLMSSVFMLAWAASGRPVAVAAAVCLVLLAGSFEGTYEIYRLWHRGQGLAELKDTNIDAITAWHFEGHRIDGLPRCLWYVPQHSMAYALGLMALTAAAAAGATTSLSAIVIQGVALAAATAINPFVGGIFAAVWGGSMAIDALRRPDPIRTIVRHAAAVAPVALALGWCIASRMVEGAGGVLEIGLRGASLHAPLLSLFLSLGPVLIPMAGGLALARPAIRPPLIPSLLLSTVALALLFFVRLQVDTSWVGFRAGQMFLVAAPPLVAWWLAASWDRPLLRASAGMAFAAVLLLGLPTTIVDAYNAQDIHNRNIGAGFHWTAVLDPEQQQAMAWIRRATPRDAIVQMEATVRDRDRSPANRGEWWSLIASFAERRMAGGLPISLMSVPAYERTSAQVKTMFESADAREASAIAHHLRLDYIYVDGLDRATYPGVEKFDHSPEQFVARFSRGPVAVYEVR